MLKLFEKKIPEIDQIELIELKARTIVSACSPVRIVLFGSASRLEMTEASDIDFLVILNDGDDQKVANKKIVAARIDEYWPQDVIIVSQSEFEMRSRRGGICQIAAEDGVELYPVNKLKVKNKSLELV